MATRAELLSRGQASRNRQWAGRGARAQVAAILFLVCAGVGAFAGWTTAPELTQRGAALYARVQWQELADPFARNLETAEARSRVSVRDAILAEDSPATRSFNSLLWRMGFFAVLIRGGFPLFDRLKRESAVKPEMMLRIATHFAGGVGPERRVGTEILQFLANRSKGRASDEARLALRGVGI